MPGAPPFSAIVLFVHSGMKLTPVQVVLSLLPNIRGAYVVQDEQESMHELKSGTNRDIRTGALTSLPHLMVKMVEPSTVWTHMLVNLRHEIFKLSTNP